VAHFRRKLRTAERNYAANEREQWAIVEAVREWRCYVEGLPPIVRTVQKSLMYAAQKKKKIFPRLYNWLAEL
jgi:hypothetical protein